MLFLSLIVQLMIVMFDLFLLTFSQELCVISSVHVGCHLTKGSCTFKQLYEPKEIILAELSNIKFN